ncbi:NADP-dependent oxidoreductase domain-containing protein 1-like [Gigantopelta aegis]|uniref:NADP-dependent oxidoreductase domain-containing protein 1-like n=1 Tax=Gigantopelta aegis TaxID=1735272 RepID=UPI001B88D7BA|nr:NADP-dependent oxidoreductase domain-containing protein 1-like [Gigantopelta aegis]
MASLSTRLNSKAKELPDITLNLESLQFESALTSEQKKLLYLRVRSHAISVTLCAQASFFIDVYNEGRQLAIQLKNRQKRKARILKDLCERDPLFIGVLGCGHVGSQIVHCLLTYGRVEPDELAISTRRPETLEYFQNKGVECYFNNVKLVSSVHILFICVLPSQLPGVAEEIKDHLSPSTVVYCTASSIPLKKLKQMLQTTNILQPDFYWETGNNSNKDYDYNMKVGTALKNRDIVEQTNPFTNKVEDLVIVPAKHFGEALLHGFLNMLSDSGLTVEESLDILHCAMFCETEKQTVKDRLKMEDFFCGKIDQQEKFPKFSLFEILENGSPLSPRIKQSPELQESFSKRYWEVFEQYISLNAYNKVK